MYVKDINGPYENRIQAGKQLAVALEAYRSSDAMVLGIPRGGVVVAYEVAKELGLSLDVIVPRKIGAPAQEELAIGAVASWAGNARFIDKHAVYLLRVSDDYIEREAQHQIKEIDRRLLLYRQSLEPPDIAGKSVIIVDDGIATGYTTRAAIFSAQNLGAAKVVLAAPVGAADSLIELRKLADEVICPKAPEMFMAVGYWYNDFRQVEDHEVIRMLSIDN